MQSCKSTYRTTIVKFKQIQYNKRNLYYILSQLCSHPNVKKWQQRACELRQGSPIVHQSTTARKQSMKSPVDHSHLPIQTGLCIIVEGNRMIMHAPGHVSRRTSQVADVVGCMVDACSKVECMACPRRLCRVCSDGERW